MMSSVFIDSNVIVKYFAGEPVSRKLLEPVLKGEIDGYINNIVFTEVIFTLIKLQTGMSAYELRRRPQKLISSVKNIDKQIMFLREYFSELEIGEEIKQLSLKIMEDYGLLPNDALIAATCKFHNVEKLLTFDEDFKRVAWLKVTP